MGAGVVGEEDRLLELVYTDAQGAEAAARKLLTDDQPRARATTAKLHWVLGLSLRGKGELDDARQELEHARAAAAESNDAHLIARITSSLAFVFGQQGDLDGALALLEKAAPDAVGIDQALLRGQLGLILYWRGALGEAARLLRESCEELGANDQFVMEARYRGNLGAVLSLLGEFEEAVSHLERARAIAKEHGLDGDAGMASANLGYVATLRGDLPGAISEYVEAEELYTSAHDLAVLPRLHADHAQALADAGLFHDADALARQAIDMYRQQGQQTELAGALLTSGEIRLAQDDVDGAIDAATEAAALFDDQRRESWAVLARSLALQARARRDRDDESLPSPLVESAEALARHGWPAEALRTRRAAARLLAERGDDPAAVLDEATRRAAKRGRAAERVLLAYIDARVASGRGEMARARRAISRGLVVAASAQAALGSIETRAHAAVHGHALAGLGARIAVSDHRPRELLRRIEATRLMTSRMPALRPPDDDQLAALLTELRSLNARLADASITDEERRDAERGRWRAERNVRRRSRAVRGDDRASMAVRGELDSALARLG
ncbi:MAG: tetratricopeptide repeat protein, partial [Acidimicrobiales bacterium]